MQAKFIGVAACAVTMASIAHGQTPNGPVPQEAPVAAGNPTDGDIVVTATRESVSVQKAPAPINVVSGATLDALHADSVADLATLVPGLKLDGNSRDQLRLGLRGAFASSTSPGSGQAVGLYIDDIPFIHTNNLGGNLFGIRQVEVLRGPQGTLYGQNVTGGLINIRTVDPGNKLEAEARASYGSFGRIEAGGLVSVPVADTLAMSLALYSTHSNGWQRNLVTGNKLDQLKTFSARFKARWRPTDDLDVKLIAEYMSDKTYGVPRNFILGDPQRFVVPQWRQTRLVFDGYYDSNSLDFGLIVNYHLGGATLTSISSYQRNRPFVSGQSFVTDPVAYQTVDRSNSSDTYTEELRIAGRSGRLSWQAGGFLLNDDVSQDQFYRTLGAPGTQLFQQGVRTESIANPLFNVRAKSYSVFAQGTFNFSKVIALTAGGRYNWDKKRARYQNSGTASAVVGVFNFPTTFSLQRSLSSNQFSPKVTLSGTWTDVGPIDSLLLYATFSKGYRTGDFSAGPTPTTALVIAPPEKAKNYEAGFKTTLLNRAISFNVTGFRTDYVNLQTLTTTSGVSTVTVASTNARAWGIEAGASVRPFHGFEVTADYAYLNTKVANGAKVGTESVAGNQLPQSPPNSYQLSARYETPLTTGSKLRFTGSYTLKDPVYFDVRNGRTLAIRDQTKVKSLDGEIALVAGRVEVAVWGKNLTNNMSVIRALGTVRNASLTPAEFAAGEIAFDGVYSEPRSIGVSAKFTY